VKNLGADTDVVDLGGGVEGFDVGSNPTAGVAGVGEGWDVAVRDGDGDEDAGVSESFDDVSVDIEDSDAVDGCAGFKEVSDFGGWWEIVAESAVVNADGGDCRYDEDDEEE